MKKFFTTLTAIISLAWTPNPADQQIQFYTIRVRGPGNTVSTVTSTAPSISISLNDTGKFTFSVTAHNAWGDSLPSATLTKNIK